MINKIKIVIDNSQYMKRGKQIKDFVGVNVEHVINVFTELIKAFYRLQNSMFSIFG